MGRLIIGTGTALANAGPASILISYSIVGLIVFVVMTALGEMATWLPIAGGFAPYATRFVDPALGFALGYTYWFKYIITTPNQLTAASLVLQYWCPPEKVTPGVFIAVFMVAIITINFLGVRFFGYVQCLFDLSAYRILYSMNGPRLICKSPATSQSLYCFRHQFFKYLPSEGHLLTLLSIAMKTH